MTKEEAVNKVITFAREQIGTHETGDNFTTFAQNADAKGWTMSAYGFTMQGKAWCDFFVDYCFWMTFGFDKGQQMLFQKGKTGGAACGNSASFFRGNGSWHGTPEAGDQVIYAGEGHTGLVVAAYGNGSFDAVDGNYSDSVVLRKGLWPSATSGFGRPDWSLVTGDDTETETDEEAEESSDLSNSDEIAAGDIVSIKRGAVFWNSTVSLPALWYTSNWIVGSVSPEGRVFLDQRENGDSGYCSAVSRIFLTKVKSGSALTATDNGNGTTTYTGTGIQAVIANKIAQTAAKTEPYVLKSTASAIHSFGGKITNVQERNK